MQNNKKSYKIKKIEEYSERLELSKRMYNGFKILTIMLILSAIKNIYSFSNKGKLKYYLYSISSSLWAVNTAYISATAYCNSLDLNDKTKKLEIKKN